MPSIGGKPKHLPLTLCGIFFYSSWSVFISTGFAGPVNIVLVDVSPVLAMQDTANGWFVRENCCGNECCSSLNRVSRPPLGGRGELPK